ncbi:MAG: hypothetical protein ACYCXZ_06575 [Coriobacteriia bacterium]
MADLTLTESVLTWLEQHPLLVIGGVRQPVSLEDPPSTHSGVWVQTLVGDPYIKRYKAGGYLAAHPFAIYFRLQADDTTARIDAMGVLGDLGRSIDDKASWPVAPEGYDFMSLALQTTPAKVAVDDAGTEDYQITFELIYRKRG